MYVPAGSLISGDSVAEITSAADKLYVNKHINHSAFHRSFLKIPYDYLLLLLEEVGKLLEKLLGEAILHI